MAYFETAEFSSTALRKTILHFLAADPCFRVFQLHCYLFSTSSDSLASFSLWQLFLHVEMLNHEMLKRVKVEESEEEGEDDKETLIESTDIADPVKNAVDISIDAMKVEIELISYLQVN